MLKRNKTRCTILYGRPKTLRSNFVNSTGKEKLIVEKTSEEEEEEDVAQSCNI